MINAEATVEFNFEVPELILHFEYFDSLQRSSRGGLGIIQGIPTWHCL
jgi:hypothetical protein